MHQNCVNYFDFHPSRRGVHRVFRSLYEVIRWTIISADDSDEEARNMNQDYVNSSGVLPFSSPTASQLMSDLN